MEKRNEKIRKALKKIDTINDYLMIIGIIYLLFNFIFSDYQKDFFGFLNLIKDTVWSLNFLYLFIADTFARFLYFNFKVKDKVIALLSSVPLGIGWLYTKKRLKQKP